MRRWLPILPLLAVVAAAQAPPRGTAAIRGRVLAADTGVPMRRAIVTITSLRDDLEGTARADDQGRYEFAELPAGGYRLAADPGPTRLDYLPQSYGASGPRRPGRVLRLVDGQRADGIDILVTRGAALSGVVTDDYGDPVSRGRVSVLQRKLGGLTRAAGHGGASLTDDQGRFRVYGLPAGDFLLVADMAGVTERTLEGEQATPFVASYYPGTNVLADGQVVTVRPGDDLQGLNIRLVRGRSFTVAGRVLNSQGLPTSATVTLATETPLGGPASFGASIDRDGTFTVRNVPWGEYVLVARTRGRGVATESAAMPLAVGSDVHDLVVVLAPGATVSGRVVIEGMPTVPANVRVVAQTTKTEYRSLNVWLPAPVASDGTFTLRNLVGPVVIRVDGRAPRPLVTKSVALGGADVTDVPVELRPGDSGRLQITASTTAATIAGRVVTDDGDPVADCVLYVFSADRARWAAGPRAGQVTGPTSDGTFQVAGLRAGAYLIVALSRDEEIYMFEAGTGVFEALSRVATSVTLGDQESKTIELRLARLPQ